MRHRPFYYLSLSSLFAAAVFVVYFVTFSLLPFEWYIDVMKVEASDVCVGDYKQTIEAERTPKWPMPGMVVHSRVIRLDNQERIETTITRSNIPFEYEDNTSAKYEVGWDELFKVPGTYTYDERQVIYPLPLISITTLLENVATFEVKECN